MPIRNVVKVFVSDSYYHVYGRGWNLTKIFIDEEDYVFFEYLISRHLSPVPVKDKKGREYTHLYPVIQLNAYCLMGNHFHLLIHQGSEDGMTKLMKSLLVAYTTYFNKKYNRRGALFESTYKAVRIDDDSQLMHITRYIHLNHPSFRTWPHSSYLDYFASEPRSSVVTEPILELFPSKEKYQEFVSDYEELKRERDKIKQDLSAE